MLDEFVLYGFDKIFALIIVSNISHYNCGLSWILLCHMLEGVFILANKDYRCSLVKIPKTDSLADTRGSSGNHNSFVHKIVFEICGSSILLVVPELSTHHILVHHHILVLEVLLVVSHVRALAHEVRLHLLLRIHALIRLETTGAHIPRRHARRPTSHGRTIISVARLRWHIHVVLHLTLSTLSLAILHLVLLVHIHVIHLITWHSGTHVAELIIGLISILLSATRVTSSTSSKIAISETWPFIHIWSHTWLRILLSIPLVVWLHLWTATHGHH